MIRNWPVIKKQLHVPQLEELRDILATSLKSNFKNVTVSVVDCPNLTEQPFTLAAAGLCGNTKIVEIGGQRYLVPLPRKKKLYNFIDIVQLCGVKKCLIIGAGAGPWPYAKTNCEGMFNLYIDGNDIRNESRISKVSKQNGQCLQEKLPNTETRFGLLANLLISDGGPGKVLKINCHIRTGKENFISSIRKTLSSFYGNKIVGMGGTFLIKEGRAKHHIMPAFSTTPIFSEIQKNKWLKFYVMSAPLIAIGTFVTGDYDLDLRLHHFHSFSHHGEAGHYHNDITPDIVEYIGYFTVANEIYRIDKPNKPKIKDCKFCW